MIRGSDPSSAEDLPVLKCQDRLRDPPVQTDG